MDNLGHLLRSSKLAQVATPISKKIRVMSAMPTHQVIYTPKNAAVRSEFGIKTPLPKQIGYSHISYNNIDNKTGMPDVEKNTSKMYSRIRLQENGVVPRVMSAKHNPLFPHSENASTHKGDDSSATTAFNLHPKVNPAEVKYLLSQNKHLYKSFQQWLALNAPQALTGVSGVSSSEMMGLIKRFVDESAVAKNPLKLSSLKKDAQGRTTHAANVTKIQGTAGLSYAQHGKITNTPNGFKSGHSIIQGRLASSNVAAVAGFAGQIMDKNASKHINYTNSVPGTHSRQFTMPFKVTEATMYDDGTVKMNLDVPKVGAWQKTAVHDDRANKTYKPTNANVESMRAKHEKNYRNLLNIIQRA
ncbi:small ribosomal subunit protein bS1m [Diutina catenulata]